MNSEEQLINLVNQKSYTELNKKINNEKLSTSNELAFKAILLNVFGKFNDSKLIIKQILNSKRLSTPLLYQLLKTQYSNHVNPFDYLEAYESKRFIMDEFPKQFIDEDIESETQEMNLWKALQKVPKQHIIMQKKVVLPLKQDQIGLNKIPVIIDKKTYEFIIDTGAKISTIVESIAKEINLKIIENTSVIVKSGITGKGNKVQIGIADKLTIGDIIINNAIFLVFSDNDLTFSLSGIVYKIDAILGLPIIKELGAITLYKNEIVLAENIKKIPQSQNMAVDLLKIIIYFNFQGSDLPMIFDSGATSTILTERFYNSHKNWVESVGTNGNISIGGAGGIKVMNIFTIPSISFQSGNQTLYLKKAYVSKDYIEVGEGIYYGNIGQDLIKQYNSITLDFKNSFISFNKKSFTT